MSVNRFLMVCTGNICRSPTAEAVMRHMALQQGVDVQVDSAGIQAYHVGESPDSRSRRAAAARGYDLTPLIARKVQPEDYRQFSHLLAMDRSHLRWLQANRPANSTAQIALFMPDESDVADPYYGGEAGFETVLDQCEAGCDYWLSAVT